MTSHIPVLLDSFLEFFEGKKIKTFVDCTVGAGGHSHAILKSHPEIEKLIGIDQDPSSLLLAREKLAEFSDKILLVHDNFVNLKSIISGNVDAIFMDLGVSSIHFDRADRGFSFSKDGPLDMRMNTNADLTAEDVLNTCSEEKLADIFYEYGGERRSRAVAKAIVNMRRRKQISSTKQLVEVLMSVLYRGRKERVHPATRVFQALRIYVNDELGVLKAVLPDAIDCLKTSGLLGVISFHSLEDRIAKWTFKESVDRIKILTKKPICATREELRENPRSRSAKMRFVEKL